MGYVALYRKYRPDTFLGIVGQENVTTILKKQIETLKISHAYIFSGTRGTGKTSAAKVFARAINCLNPINGEPCNECEACKSILNGDTTDVVEMDAASNNSVENIRQIRSEVMYAATTLKYRVYIIDEVHMLTTSAFNALLKTLEEPPENVVFILATTEQHKIPVTILSRCLRFEFSRISEEKIKERLEFVLKEENVKYEEEAISYIAKLADGALRDALSILDRCLSEKDDILTLKNVQEIIGSIDQDIIINITKAILESNSKKILENISLVTQKGKDLRQLIYEIMQEFLDMLIQTKDLEESLKLTNIIDELAKLDTQIRMSTRPTIVIKAALIRISNFKKIDSNENILNSNCDQKRIDILENELLNIKSMIKNRNITIDNSNNSEKEKSKQNDYLKNNENRNENRKNNNKFNGFEEFKKILASKGKLKLFSALAGSDMNVNDNSVNIITNNEFAYRMLSLDEQRNTIHEILKEEFNMDLPISINLKKENSMSKMEKVLKDNNIEYTNLD